MLTGRDAYMIWLGAQPGGTGLSAHWNEPAKLDRLGSLKPCAEDDAAFVSQQIVFDNLDKIPADAELKFAQPELCSELM